MTEKDYYFIEEVTKYARLKLEQLLAMSIGTAVNDNTYKERQQGFLQSAFTMKEWIYKRNKQRFKCLVRLENIFLQIAEFYGRSFDNADAFKTACQERLLNRLFFVMEEEVIIRMQMNKLGYVKLNLYGHENQK